MNKSFVVERNVLIQVWKKQKIRVENVNDLGEAITKVRKCKEEKICNRFNIDTKILQETEQIISSEINTSNCYEIPNQEKLTFNNQNT